MGLGFPVGHLSVKKGPMLPSACQDAGCRSVLQPQSGFQVPAGESRGKDEKQRRFT